MADALTIDSLSVRLGRRQVLRDVTLRVEDRGHIVGLFGQNGAGKSTLMRVICGMVNRYEGSVTTSETAIGYLPDAPFLYPFLTVRDCVRLAQDLWDDFDEDVARDILSSLGLDDRLRVRQASKGMLEQLHLGLVLARRCQLYVFDEPLAAVDPLTRDRLIEMIRAFRSPDSTVIISTHLIAGLEELFDEAVVVHGGTIVLHEDLHEFELNGGLEARVKEVIAADALVR